VGQSLVRKHCTHWSAWHVGVAAGQSLFWRHTTHWPSGLHSFAVGEVQSVSARHCTHVENVVLQMGVSPWQPAFDVQPARHVKSCGSQMGCAVPQSALERQSTHWPSATRQRGALAGQSVFVAHWTHCCVAESQTGRGPPQPVGPVHPTHAPTPDEVSQTGAWGGQSWLPVHAAWHAWSPGQHDGVAAGQLVLEVHSAHWPMDVTQKGAVAGQSPFAVQSTQPRTKSHCCPLGQWSVPLTPHSALPGPAPPPTLLLDPPHATRIPTTTDEAANQKERWLMRQTVRLEKGPGSWPRM
jgi:hypothetical protein